MPKYRIKKEFINAIPIDVTLNGNIAGRWGYMLTDIAFPIPQDGFEEMYELAEGEIEDLIDRIPETEEQKEFREKLAEAVGVAVRSMYLDEGEK